MRQDSGSMNGKAGDAVMQRPRKKRPTLKQVNDNLAAELALTKATLKAVREERCLDALQAVLEKHQCQMMALPNGQFQVVFVG